MSCPTTESWHALSTGLLSPETAAELCRHAGVCAPCAKRLLAARQDHVALQRSFEVFDREHEQLREQLMARLPDAHPVATRRRNPHMARSWPGVITMSIKQHKVRWAAVTLAPAACILVAVVALMSAGPGVVFAEVLERMRQARTMACALSTKSSLTTQIESVEQEKTTAQHGRLMMYADGTVRAWRMDLRDPPLTQWNVPGGMVVEQDGEVRVTRFGAQDDAGFVVDTPQRWLQRMLDVVQTPDRVLGRKAIAGREAVGFEIAGWRLGFGARESDRDDLSSWVRIWVDPDSKLPLRMEFEQHSATPVARWTLTGVWDDIEWDVPLDPAEFEPPAATSDTLVQELKLPPVGEASFVAAVERWRAETDRLREVLDTAQARDRANADPARESQYSQLVALVRPECVNPPSMDTFSLLPIASARRAMRLAAARAGQDERAAQATPPEDGQSGSSWASMTMFVRQLALDGRDPVYDSAAVEPDQALLRWRLDERHERVIFGDLHAETLPLAP